MSPKSPGIPIHELLPRISVALPPEMLQGVGRRHGAQLRRRDRVGPARHALEKPAPEGVADTGRIHDPHGRHGGTIDLESAPGKGTTARIVLPLVSAAPVPGRAAAS